MSVFDMTANDHNNRLDLSEIELPETLYISDIDQRVFRSIVLQCIEQIEGISSVEALPRKGWLFRFSSDQGENVIVEQEPDHRSVSIKIEVAIDYGMPIPEKAEEVQKKIATTITHMTGLHVSCVHVVFTNSVLSDHSNLSQTDRKKNVE